MNIEHYTYLLANPQKITTADLSELDRLVQTYPYLQSARALQLKGLKNQNSFRYNDALKITAAHTADRDILFEYITSDKFVQNEISQTILQHDTTVLDIGVVSENISEKVQLEKEEEWKTEKDKADAILNPNLFQRKVSSVANIVSQTEKTEKENIEPEEQLVTDKPLEFTQNDTHSFAEWLKLTKAKPIERTETPEAEPISGEPATEDVSTATSAEEEKERKFELIDRFIQERPKIMPGNPSTNPSDTSDKGKINTPDISSAQPTDSLMTETLARVYLQQKNYKKAIQAYKILILKNPEKSGFFADQIRAIEKLINTEKQ